MTLVVEAETNVERTDDPSRIIAAEFEALFPEAEQYQRFRRIRLAAITAVLVIGGIALGVEATGSGHGAPPSGLSGFLPAAHGIPGPLTSAVEKTLAVQSVEIVTNYGPGPAIYQAPTLYAAPEDVDLATAGSLFYVAGASAYWVDTTEEPSQPIHFGQFPRSMFPRVDGLPAAREMAFQDLLFYVRTGNHFVRTTGGDYTFRARAADISEVMPSSAHNVVGTISLSHGFVVGVTVRAPHAVFEIGSFHPGTFGALITIDSLTTRYEHIDDNPHLVAPSLDKSMCRALGSLVLQAC